MRSLIRVSGKVGAVGGSETFTRVGLAGGSRDEGMLECARVSNAIHLRGHTICQTFIGEPCSYNHCKSICVHPCRCE